LKEVGIKPGFYILDYGCGAGSYTIPAAQLVGNAGKVYALDIHPLAIQLVQSIAVKRHLTNIEAILSDCATGLPANNLDVVLLYDTFHSLNDPNCVLDEIYRTLKPNGVLSLNDHHLKEAEITSKVTSKGLFKLSEKGRNTYIFTK
jgi:ubiquinone/menaquinone biosynthesis C-methylase UbiE